MKKRLVTFLGTGGREGYQKSTYQLGFAESERITTRFVCHALAKIYKVTDIQILATNTARIANNNEDNIRASFANDNLPEPNFHEIPGGSSSEELWKQFEVIKNNLRVPQDFDILLDITHGFRSQPFLAAAVVAFIRNVDPNPKEVQVVYGAYEATRDGITPIWDISEFIDIVDYARWIQLFLRNGNASDISKRIKDLGKQLNKKRAQSKQKEMLNILKFGTALESFGEDLVTVRTGSLLLGEEKNSVHHLHEVIDQVKTELQEYLPPVADVLKPLEDMLKSIQFGQSHLNTPEGQKGMAALARLYHSMGRYAEAAAILREGWITLYADDKADCPGTKGYDTDARKVAEELWRRAEGLHSNTISEIRNDIEHAGFKKQPIPAGTLVKKISTLIEDFSQSTRKEPVAEINGCFANISNHPSSNWSQQQLEAAKELADEIVDIPFPNVSPHATSEDLEVLAEEVLLKIPDNTTHALVQGEYTLTFLLVQKLHMKRIVCLAATTERNVTLLPDGTRNVAFDFIRFRTYL